MSDHDDDPLDRLREIVMDGLAEPDDWGLYGLDQADVATICWAVAEIERSRAERARRPVPYRPGTGATAIDRAGGEA